MQACRVLNAIRSPERGTGGVDRVATEKFDETLESFATELWFNEGRPFKLDGRCNLLLLSVDEYYLWDVYGIYAFSPSYTDLNSILYDLAMCNSDWATRAASNVAAGRNLVGQSNLNSIICYTIRTVPSQILSEQVCMNGESSFSTPTTFSLEGSTLKFCTPASTFPERLWRYRKSRCRATGWIVQYKLFPTNPRFLSMERHR
ncbi:hypothetical protein DFH06DRAFT_1220005 [Mycena polygramma]|nr:hypothetical protein DFH06DRAFT_1220005 [Mycena polygramma]